MRAIAVLAAVSLVTMLAGCLVIAEGGPTKKNENGAVETPDVPGVANETPEVEIYELITLVASGAMDQAGEVVDVLVPDTAVSLSILFQSDVHVATIRGQGHTTMFPNGTAIDTLIIESNSSVFTVQTNLIKHIVFRGDQNMVNLLQGVTVDVEFGGTGNRITKQ